VDAGGIVMSVTAIDFADTPVSRRGYRTTVYPKIDEHNTSERYSNFKPSAWKFIAASKLRFL
jgi:hypothetical protein